MSNGASTYVYDGIDCTLLPTLYAPDAHSEHAMAYDSFRGSVVMYGGSIPLTRGVWRLTGQVWTCSLDISEPVDCRWDHRMAYHAGADQVMVLGGHNITGDWMFPAYYLAFSHNPEATVVPFGVGCGTLPLSLDASSGSRPVLGLEQRSRITGFPSFLPAISIGLSCTQIGAQALPLPLDAFGLTGCHLYQDTVVLFLPTVLLAPGVAEHVLPLPSNPSLMSLPVYLQAWAPALGLNPAGLVTSNGLALTLGDH
jgi:hypothetical protein